MQPCKLHWDIFVNINRVVTYQIFLLVHEHVNGQSPLVQPRFTCPKIDVFSSPEPQAQDKLL